MQGDQLGRAIEVIEEASARRIHLRLLGGLAVRYLCPDFPARTRDDQDLDLASVSRDRSRLRAFLEERGFRPDPQFNALHGHKQMYFSDGRYTLDVMLDRLDMCHVLDFQDRIALMPVTLHPTDLLLSKLQIVEINEKDLQDAIYLLARFAIGADDESGALDPTRLCQIVCADWGWWRTVSGNLERIASLAPEDVARLAPPDPPLDPVRQAGELLRLADEAPKSLRWKLRAKVGERVRWYELPEEVEHR